MTTKAIKDLKRVIKVRRDSLEDICNILSEHKDLDDIIDIYIYS